MKKYLYIISMIFYNLAFSQHTISLSTTGEMYLAEAFGFAYEYQIAPRIGLNAGGHMFLPERKTIKQTGYLLNIEVRYYFRPTHKLRPFVSGTTLIGKLNRTWPEYNNRYQVRNHSVLGIIYAGFGLSYTLFKHLSINSGIRFGYSNVTKTYIEYYKKTPSTPETNKLHSSGSYYLSMGYAF